MRESFSMQVDGSSRKRDRLKKMSMEVARIDMKKCNQFEDLARIDWNGKMAFM